jgi:membrane protease YdiL (CAAX protease family)
MLVDEDMMHTMSTMEAPGTDPSRRPLAPWWHTVLVLLPLAAGSIASAYQGGLPNAHVPGLSWRLSAYVTVLAQEWFVVGLIWIALRQSGASIGDLVRGRWQTRRAVFRDVGLAVAFLVVAVPLVGLLARVVGGTTSQTLANIIPHTSVELVVWLGLAATGGFCEELVFRGYLARQFGAWTGSRAMAVFLQGVVFGLAHGYYRKAMIVVMVQGWLLGLLAFWRRSLRPGMLAHALQDTIGGIVGFLHP